MTGKKLVKVLNKSFLEYIYEKYNDRKFVHPDPLEFLYEYPDLNDREVVGIIASSLAYGNVKQILKSVKYVLDVLGARPSDFLKEARVEKLKSALLDFKHRFTNEQEILLLLKNLRNVLIKYGSIKRCFIENYKKEQGIVPALLNFVVNLRAKDCNSYNSLLPLPEGKCAYKRLNLFLRWMVRKDNVDPGGWDDISPSQLIIPLDVHMYRFALDNNIISRRIADLKTAIEITNFFKKFSPEDPVKYDFALTRRGMSKN